MSERHATFHAMSPEELRRHVRTYVAVFVTLACLTVVTVAIASLHLPTWGAITLALIIATIKASLVICFFMHLISEKNLIKYVLILTTVFFAGLLLAPVLTELNQRVL